jgi:hypothetical protein
MRFAPKSENEIAADGLLTPGIYDFQITDAEDAISKASGAEMIKLTINVFNEDGTATVIYDYLMEKVAYKLRHAAEACGLLGAYDRGELDAIDFRDRTGRCKVAVQKDRSGQYPDKNSIADYLKSDTPELMATPRPASARPSNRVKSPAGADMDDEVPF